MRRPAARRGARGAALALVLVLALALLAPPAGCAARDVIAVGDLHGDLLFAAATLHLAKVIDGQGNWIAGDATLVQVGDIVDRGPDPLAIYRWFNALQRQALLSGGRFVRLLGNHEVMNFQGDLRFVSDDDFLSFGGRELRAISWSDQGTLGHSLRALNITALVDDSVFCHAGLLPSYARAGTRRLNDIAHQVIEQQDWAHPIFHDNGPVWTRAVIYTAQQGECGLLRESLRELSAAEGREVRRMVVGHTPRMSRMVESYCDGALWGIDVGISRWVAGAVGALRIAGDRCEPILPPAVYSLEPALNIVTALTRRHNRTRILARPGLGLAPPAEGGPDAAATRPGRRRWAQTATTGGLPTPARMADGREAALQMRNVRIALLVLLAVGAVLFGNARWARRGAQSRQ